MKNDQIQYQGLVTWTMFVRAHMVDLKSNLFRLSLFPIIFAPFIWIMDSTILNRILATLIAISFVPVFIVMQRVMLYWSFKRSPFFREPMSGIISSAGLQIENSLGNSEMKWQMFNKFREKDNCILLYTSPNSFQLLAKEFFANDEDWMRAKETVSLGMQGRA